MVKPRLYQRFKKISQAWWHIPVVRDTRESEAGESLEPRRWRLQWAEIAALGSSLGNESETLSRKNKNKNIRTDPRWPIRSSSRLQLSAKAWRVSGCCISRQIFIAHRQGDSQSEEPHGSPAWLVWPPWRFWLAQLFCQRPGTVVLHTKYKVLGTVLAGEWRFWETQSPIHLIKKGTDTGSQARRFPLQKHTKW